MVKYNSDNIVAIATANGYAGVGIIRISGYKLQELALKLTLKTIDKPRHCYFSGIFDSDNNQIDSALVVYFASPNSFTGEEVLEIQGHGSPIVLQMILKRCVELGCRLAEAGEFTKRAYLNGKIDLVQAESIIDLIHAESEASAKSAFKSLQGVFSQNINSISQELINLRMFVEASIDFPEEDIEFIQQAKIKEKLSIVRASIYKLLDGTKQGVILNNGANIVIIGRPNVGKSSLLNALANEEVAIVTDIAGTTRDIVKQKIIINGIVFNIIDTAGIRTTEDTVEKIGISRAFNAITTADIALILLDNSGITNADQEIIDKLPANLAKIYLHNKIDLSGEEPRREVIDSQTHIYLSAKTNTGITQLRNELLNIIGYKPSEDTFIARSRHLQSMKQTVIHIDNAFANWENLELLAEELRYSHSALMSIVGEFSADDLLGEIFSKFCIGK